MGLGLLFQTLQSVLLSGQCRALAFVREELGPRDKEGVNKGDF